MSFDLQFGDFDKIIKRSYALLENPEEREQQAVAKLWQGLSHRQLHAEPRNWQRMRQLFDAIHRSHSAPLLQQTVAKIERQLCQTFYQEAVAEQHLSRLFGCNLQKHSFYGEIIQAYPRIKETLNMRVLFNLFADDWGLERKNLFGAEWEGGHSTAVLRYLIALGKELPQAVLTRKLLSHYEAALYFAEKIDSAKTSCEIRQVVEELCRRIATLQPGESIELSAGWSGLPSTFSYPKHEGHAIAIQLLCTSSGHYAFRLLNSGSGLGYHGKGERRDHHAPALEWDNLSLKGLTQPELWETLFEARVVPRQRECERPYYDAEYLYGQATRFLGAECPSPIQSQPSPRYRVSAWAAARARAST